MRLLLDENLPKRLKEDLKEYEVYTVSDKSWNGIKNGKLLELMIENDFQALLTFDKNLQHQQNFNRYSIAVLVLHAPVNTYKVLSALIPHIKHTLSQKILATGPTIIKG